MKTTRKQPHGSENLSEAGTSPKERSTNAASAPLNPTTLKDLGNVTFSLESEAGPSPSVSRASPTMKKSGQPHVRVSRFRARESGSAMPTNDTCGPLFLTSSPSVDLQRSLENRLRAKMDVNGSPEYALTWKEWDMPAGLPICALRGSQRRSSDSGFTGWPAPMAGSPATENYNEAGNTDSSRKTVDLVGWANPLASEARQGFQDRSRGKKGRQESLTTQVALNVQERERERERIRLSGWFGPSSRDWKDTPGMSTTG